jgi:hypothetical protein
MKYKVAVKHFKFKTWESHEVVTQIYEIESDTYPTVGEVLEIDGKRLEVAAVDADRDPPVAANQL